MALNPNSTPITREQVEELLSAPVNVRPRIYGFDVDNQVVSVKSLADWHYISTIVGAPGTSKYERLSDYFVSHTTISDLISKA